MTFHGKSRADAATRQHMRESPWVVTGPLLALAVPSVVAGFMFFEPVLGGALFGDSIHIAPGHDASAQLAATYAGKHGAGLIFAAVVHGVSTAPFWLAVAGIALAWYAYCKNPALPSRIATAAGPLHRLLLNKYGFDAIYQKVFARGALRLGDVLFQRIDAGVIDESIVNNTARAVKWSATVARKVQTGFTHHYAFAMIVGLFCLITVFVWL